MEIVWLPSADEAFIKVLQNVDNLFGSLIAERVADKIYSHIDLLSSFPNMGVCDSRFSTLEVRYLVNTPNIVYYTKSLSKDKIIIISIFNSRQSPENMYQMLVDALKANALL